MGMTWGCPFLTGTLKIHIFRFQFDPKLFTLQKLNQGPGVTTGSVNFGDGIVARFGCHSLQHIIWELHQGCTLGRGSLGSWRLARGNRGCVFVVGNGGDRSTSERLQK